MKFTAKVVSMVPTYYSADVEIDADSQQEADSKIREMYKSDEVEYVDPESDFDGAEIVSITFDRQSA